MLHALIIDCSLSELNFFSIVMTTGWSPWAESSNRKRKPNEMNERRRNESQSNYEERASFGAYVLFF